MNVTRSVQVLVVDDSAVMRQSMITIARRASDIEVTVAADPLIAQSKIANARPDVILLDIEMPRMDGLTFLHKLMSEDPIPVVVCSALAGRGTETALRALEEGAVDVVPKPRLGLQEYITESSESLLDTIRAAAQAKVRRMARPTSSRAVPAVVESRRSPMRTSRKIIALGASTGGTEVLREILREMPQDAPGVVVVQHMPEQFTTRFAERLNHMCRIEVKEAQHGDAVTEGRALIAPGNRHLEVVRSGAEYRVQILENQPPVSRHRPSVDVMFRSVARAAGINAVGVILTGMGSDGADGLLEMRKAGAVTIAQDEATSVVFGMPREAIARGAAQLVRPLPQIAPAVLEAVAQMNRDS